MLNKTICSVVDLAKEQGKNVPDSGSYREHFSRRLIGQIGSCLGLRLKCKTIYAKFAWGYGVTTPRANSPVIFALKDSNK